MVVSEQSVTLLSRKLILSLEMI